MNGLAFQNAQVRVTATDRTFHPKEAVVRASAGSVEWDWGTVRVVCKMDSEGVASISVANQEGDLPLSRISLDWPANNFLPKLDTREFVQLYHSRDFTKLAGVRAVHRPVEWSSPTDASAMVTVFARRSGGEAVLLGALPPYGDCFADFPILHESTHRDGDFGVGIHLQARRRVKAGETLELAQLAILKGEEGNELLKRYSALLRGRVEKFLKPKPRATGWNTWDYYAGAVREADVREHAQFSRRRYGDQLRYMVIDEGYESQWGIWEAGWKFTSGLKALCEEIRAEGYEPGIWTAPLMVNVYTPLYRENPDWFVGDAQGNVFLQSLAYGSMAQLDITHPDAALHIEEQFRRLREAGFTYFKCDFTQLLLGASTFASDELSHAGMLRSLFLLIRRAIGDEAYLLACGAPYEAVIGIADSHRTTGDIHHYWSQIRQNIRSMLARWWMQDAVGNTDPDFAIARCSATTEDLQLARRKAATPWSVGANWTNGREMELEEAKALLLACYVTGGDLILGDALPKLNVLGLELLERVLQERVAPGVPINLFAYDGDEVPIVVAKGEGKRLVAVFNLTDFYRPVRLPEAYASMEAEWTDFWTEERSSGHLAAGGITLPPRSSRAWWVEDSPPEQNE